MEQDEQGNWYIKVPLIGETKRRLEELQQYCGEIGAPSLAASLLHDILEDDESAHVSPDVVADGICGNGKLH